MPKPEKWADFTRTAVVSKQSKHGGAKMVDYAQFACPYNCGVPVEIPTSIASNNKSTKCRSHLMRCSGVSDDGLKAEDDPRVKEIRLAASGKRARTDGAADVSETAIVPCNAWGARGREWAAHRSQRRTPRARANAGGTERRPCLHHAGNAQQHGADAAGAGGAPPPGTEAG